MRNALLALLVLAAATPTLAPHAHASPSASQRRFAVAGFDGVEASGPDRVVVVPGPATSVVASGDPAILEALDVGVRGATLHVGRRPGRYHDRGITITVTTPAFTHARLIGSGGIHARRTTGSRFVAEVSGSGEIAVDTLQVANARLAISGSGDIAARGRADHLTVEVSGSGDLDATGIATRTLELTASGSAGVRARASGSATIILTGSGSVDVVGTRDCHVTRTGSGSVRCGPRS